MLVFTSEHIGISRSSILVDNLLEVQTCIYIRLGLVAAILLRAKCSLLGFYAFVVQVSSAKVGAKYIF